MGSFVCGGLAVLVMWGGKGSTVADSLLMGQS